tara:strand:+ start:259 stop:573 length:315 start_codon:yes stop_codon:yes gene_type:complete
LTTLLPHRRERWRLFRKRKNKWEVQIRVRGCKNICKTFLYREHAFKWARETEIKVEKGVYQELRELHSIKFKDLVKRYLIEISPKKKSYPKEKNERGLSHPSRY